MCPFRMLFFPSSIRYHITWLSCYLLGHGYGDFYPQLLKMSPGNPVDDDNDYEEDLLEQPAGEIQNKIPL